MYTRTTAQVCLLIASLLLPGFVECQGEIGRRITWHNSVSVQSPEQTRVDALVLEIFDEVHSVEELADRVDVAREVIQLGAKTIPERRPKLLRSLFDSALENAKSEKDQTRAQLAVDQIRNVIEMAGAFDYKLAASLVEEYLVWKEEKDTSNSSSTAAPERANFNLSIAISLVDRNPELATSFAEKSISRGFGPEILPFLWKLRGREPALSDRFFRSALSGITSRKATDVNELMVLYSYLFSPLRVPYLTNQGLANYYVAGIYEPGLAPTGYRPSLALASEFIRAITDLFGVARYESASVRQLRTGVAGDAYFLSLIATPASTYAPHLKQPLEERLRVIAGFLNSETIAKANEQAARFGGLESSPGGADRPSPSTIEELVRRATESNDSSRKDRFYCEAASKAVDQKKYGLALELVTKVQPANRDSVEDHIRFAIAEQMASDRKVDEAAEIAKKISEPLRRISILLKASRAFCSNDGQDTLRAAEFLTQAQAMASKLPDPADRVSVLLSASAVFATFDRIQAAACLDQAFKESNKLPVWKASRKPSVWVQVGDFYFFHEMFDDAAHMKEAVTALGKQDFIGTLLAIRMLNPGVARIRAKLALCRAIEN
jgi:hypothetical protein